MQRSLGRIVVRVACTAVVGGLCVPVEAGGAEPAIESEMHQPAEVAWVAEHFGIIEAEAARRMDIEDAAGALQQLAETRWAETFAGMWLNDHGQDVTLTVAFTRDVDDRVAELAASSRFRTCFVASATIGRCSS